MGTAIFYGAGNDLVEVRGIEIGDGPDKGKMSGEYNCYSNDPSDLVSGIFVIKVDDVDILNIYALYDGCWSFAVFQLDEDVPLPDWTITIKQSSECSYSTELRIECPDNAILYRVDD